MDKKITYKGVLFYYIIFFAVLGCKESVAQEQVKTVSAKEMQTLIEAADSVQLIDVRTPQEYKEGHLRNAKNIDFLSSSFSKDINVLDKQKPVFIYCRSGKRSTKSVKEFLDAGFTEIYNLEGGILQWEAQGLNIEKE
ncbi:rhodanese-like domain-containing protein [Mariniflexile sp.]|uniref:rhodanese-like domain-containing protein n=1 Tax=Mariniflexile sp. TaxID=1979402 RepID=UPI004048E0BB